MDNIPITASHSERKQAIYWFCVVFIHLNGLLRPATYCTERELNTCCRRILDLLDLCLYFNEADDEDEVDDEHKPGFIKRSGLRVEGPNGLTNSFLVAIFAALIQSFDDLRKQNSNRLVAANTLFVAAADLVVNHTLMAIKEFADTSVEDRVSSIEESDNEPPELHPEDDKENIPEVTKSSSPTYKKNILGTARRRRRDDDLSEGDSEDSYEDSSSDEQIIYETDEDSVYSQEIESDDNQPISKRNLNNNTNHPILEEEFESEKNVPKSDTRKLACSFMNRANDIGEDIEELSDSDNRDDDEEPDEDDPDCDDEMIFEFENEAAMVEQAKVSDSESQSDSEEVNICLEDVVKNFESFYFLESMKLICDWLQVNGDIVRANLKSPLWARIPVVFMS